MAEKGTVMVLKVKCDLQCSCCYKNVKKILCKIPEIKDQQYDEKANTVTITVLSCNPEKIRDKLCCKGDKVIQGIEIKKPEKPEPPKPKPEPEKKPEPAPPVWICCWVCYERYGGGPWHHGHGVPLLRSCHGGYHGWGCGCGCGRGMGWYYEENPPACAIM